MKNISLVFILLGMVCCMGWATFNNNTQSVAQSSCKAFFGGGLVDYEGECKRGMAEGFGRTLGDDYYEGKFKKGMPHGKGNFYWANGDTFEGVWKKGVKEGKGTLVLKREGQADSVVIGVWKEDEYIGSGKPEVAYKIKRNLNVRRYRFQKVGEGINEVEIRITRNTMPFGDFTNLVFNGTSGVPFNRADYRGHSAIDFPFHGNVSLSAPTQLRTTVYSVLLIYEIYEPGQWVLTIEV